MEARRSSPNPNKPITYSAGRVLAAVDPPGPEPSIATFHRAMLGISTKGQPRTQSWIQPWLGLSANLESYSPLPPFEGLSEGQWQPQPRQDGVHSRTATSRRTAIQNPRESNIAIQKAQLVYDTSLLQKRTKNSNPRHPPPPLSTGQFYPPLLLGPQESSRKK